MVKLVTNRGAWGWCLPKWAVIPGRATSLEPQALSRAHGHPQQLCEWQPPTRHCQTDQVTGGTCTLPTQYLPTPPLREGGEGGKAEQLNLICASFQTKDAVEQERCKQI